MLTRMKMRLLHRWVHPICNERLAGSLMAEVLRSHIKRATYNQHANHEDLTVEELDILTRKQDGRKTIQTQAR